MIPKVTLSDSGTLSIRGKGCHVLIREAGQQLSIAGKDKPGDRWSNAGLFPMSSVKHIDAIFTEGPVPNFLDAFGVTIPRTTEGCWDATRWGKQSRDIIAQRNSQDCSHEAALGSWLDAGNGVWIQYIGPTTTGAVYRVRVGVRDHMIQFDGTPRPMDYFQKVPFTFWQHLEHRSYELVSTGTHASLSICDLRGYDPMAQIDGRLKHWSISSKYSNAAQTYAQIIPEVQMAIFQKKIVISESNFNTPMFNGFPVAQGYVHPAIIAAHTYAILGTDGVDIIFWNPHGKDKDGATIGKADDGVGRLKVKSYLDSMQSVWIG